MRKMSKKCIHCKNFKSHNYFHTVDKGRGIQIFTEEMDGHAWCEIKGDLNEYGSIDDHRDCKDFIPRKERGIKQN